MRKDITLVAEPRSSRGKNEALVAFVLGGEFAAALVVNSVGDGSSHGLNEARLERAVKKVFSVAFNRNVGFVSHI